MAGILLILGASVRAAAWSAMRAGFQPFGGDLFADEDLRRLAPAIRVEDYPEELAAVAAAAPPGPWMYTGGLENYPVLVDRIAEKRQLLGNPGHTLSAIRDPFQVTQVLRESGLACPTVLRTAAELPREGRWLRKPLRSSGGHGITICEPAAADDSSRHYLQQWIDGVSHAAVYVAAEGQAVLVGVTRQLVGTADLGAGPFQYSGSIGPLSLPAALQEQFDKIGQTLARTFGLVGLIGVDAVVAGGIVWPVEVNPRYSASIEVLERGYGVSAMRFHVDACLRGRLRRQSVTERRCWCGKAIVYARANVTAPTRFPRIECRTGTIHLADIPAAGSSMLARQPVLTVLAEAEEEESLLDCLREGVLAIERSLY